MIRRIRPLAALSLSAILALALAACPQADPEPEPPVVGEPAPGEPVAVQVIQAQLQEIEGSGVMGIARIELNGDELRVSVSATGLETNAPVPQHVHLEATCDPAGGILINLDDGLTVAGEGPPAGDAYPQADGDGNLEYEASRSVHELESALQQHHGLGLDALELGNRVVNVHDPELPPVACGPLEPVGDELN